MNLLKEASWYTGTAVIERAVPLVLLPFLTRVLLPEEYGLITLFVVVATLCGSLVGFGLDGFVRVIFFRVGEAPFRAYLANVFSLFLVTFVSTLGLVLVFGKQLEQWSGLPPYWLMFAVVVAGTRFLISVRLNLYQIQHEVWRYSALQLFTAGADVLLVMTLVFYFSGGGEGRLYALISATFLAGAIACFDLVRKGLINFQWQGDRIKRALAFSLPVLPHSFALMAVFAFDKMIITNYRGLELTGLLAVTLSLASPSMIIAESINKALLPWSFEKLSEDKRLDVVAVSYLLILGMIAFCLLYSLALLYFYDVIVGEHFQQTRSAALVLVWAGLGKLIYFLTGKGLGYLEITKPLPAISITGGVVYLGMLLVVIETADLRTIAWLIVGYHCYSAICMAVYGQIRFPQPWSDFRSAFRLVRGGFAANR